MKRKRIIALFLFLSLLLCGCSSASSEKKDIVEIPEHQVYLDIDFEQNLLLATYDVEVYIDDTEIGTIEHGKNLTSLINVKEGSHTITFYKATDNSVKSKKEIKVVEDTTYVFLIHSNRSSIEIKKYEAVSGIEGNELAMLDVVGLNYAEAKDRLESAGFVNINYKTPNDDLIWDNSAWLVVSQNINGGEIIDKNDKIVLSVEKPQPSAHDAAPTSTPASEIETTPSDLDSDDNVSYKHSAPFHSSNDLDEAKNGDSGVYAYSTLGNSYDIYIIIDFDEGYLYRFLSNEETCERVKIENGDSLNSAIAVTYHDGNDIWQEKYCFRWSRHPDHLVNVDYYGYETDFYYTDLDEALELRSSKRIKDY